MTPEFDAEVLQRVAEMHRQDPYLEAGVPGFWMNECSGVLRPAVEAYLRDEPLSDEAIAALRAYLRQWIAAPAWQGREVEQLRRDIDGLTSRQAIHHWVALAVDTGIDPF